ncbi:putative glucan 1,3-beta-glucosidase [Kockovaella imperatae]|uniref:Putative glucan 1,3-beta-glucosidase n=1 Tax=Kockovaella imperatae TaxID=4999 RepID=A0A1Y1UBH7_9TREE|nr:putative glucan 1,3-beta-glucosidase [Kockovaella imperatae]ORX34435.1 putative glucan 1,3-beta-glucosidase [Kockovaella imperatae]
MLWRLNLLVLTHALARLSHATPRLRQNDQVEAPGFTWGGGPMRGVNIGGCPCQLLTVQPWITPSIFTDKPDWVVDEWTYGAYMRTRNDTYGEISQHWNTWFQYDELENIAAVGLNTIRIQIGYWSIIPLVNGEPYLVGAYDYLKIAVTWARTLNLKVMLDLHGVPGSQNGFDNSGLRGTRQWFSNYTNLQRSLNALQILTEEFTQSSYGNTVQTIELVNEPFPYTDDELNFLKNYYIQGYNTVRGANQQQQIVVALDDGFRGLQSWSGFMTETQYHDVALDTGPADIRFNNYTLAMGYTELLEWFCSQEDYIVAANQKHWTIVGEWTLAAAANTDCAKWLNGRDKGARYDGTLPDQPKIRFTGDCVTHTGSDPSKWSSDYIEFLGRAFETQTYVYEKASGYIMWTWKTEQAADWSMQAGITYGKSGKADSTDYQAGSRYQSLRSLTVGRVNETSQERPQTREMRSEP